MFKPFGEMNLDSSHKNYRCKKTIPRASGGVAEVPVDETILPVQRSLRGTPSRHLDSEIRPE